MKQFMWRRMACAVMIAALSAVVLTSAFGSAASAKAKKKAAPLSGTLTMLAVSGEPFQASVAAFEKLHPKVHINLSFEPPGVGGQQEFETLVQAHHVPDIFYVNPGTIQALGTGKLYKAHLLANLAGSPWVAEIPATAQSLWVKGRGKNQIVFGYPFDVQGVGLTYNATEFSQLGLKPPTTWSALLSLCGKIKADGKQPLLISGQSPAMPVMNIAVNTVYTSNPHWNIQRGLGKVTFAGTGSWTTVMNRMKTLATDCLAPGWSGLSVPSVFSEMAAGDALMAELPTGATESIVAAGASDKFDSEPFPSSNNPKTANAQAYWSDGLAVSATSHHKQLAEAFLDYLSTIPASRAYAKAAYTLSLSQANSGTVPADMAAFGPYFKSGRIVQRPYDAWAQPGMYLAIESVPTAIMLGQSSVAQGLKELDDSWGKQTATP